MLHFPSRRKLNGADPPASSDRQSASERGQGYALCIGRALVGVHRRITGVRDWLVSHREAAKGCEAGIPLE